MSLKATYTSGARGLASRSMTGLARTRVTPNMLTAAGVTLCAVGAVLVYFEYRDEVLFFWLGEGLMLGAIALVFMRDGKELALALAVAAIGGSFLVPYARAKAEGLGIKGDVGIGSRAERVVVISVGLALAPWGVLPWAIGVLAATAWFTVLQRILHVRRELRAAG